jgi:phosphatidylinositol glycan class S
MTVQEKDILETSAILNDGGGAFDPIDGVVTIAETSKKPPPESPESARIRTLVVFSFWAVVIFLGLPIWWKTTAIYRAKLPLRVMMEWADGKVCFSTWRTRKAVLC